MKITILHKDGCPLCDVAIREFIGDDHEVELLHSLSEIRDMDRRCDMMTDLLAAGGDKDAFPIIFVYDRFVPWKPKKGNQHG